MKRTWITGILSILALAGRLAVAEDAAKPGEPGKPGEGKRPSPEEIFKKLDANADGSVSKDEFMAGPRAKQDPAKGGEHFTRMDTDKDGKLSKEEFAKRPEGKGGKPGDAPKKP